MMKHIKLLTFLTKNTALEAALDVGDMQQLIHEGLYALPTLLSVDKSALWLINAEKDSFHCEADFLDRRTKKKMPTLLKKNDDPEFFSFLMKVTDVIFENVNISISPDTNIRKLGAVFHAHSFGFVPIQVKGINKGFIFLGDSQQGVQWPPEVVLTCNVLSQLFSRAVVAAELKRVETKLLHKQELAEEIESLAKVGGWEYEIATGKIHWSVETFRIYGLPTDNQIGLNECISFYSPETQKLIKTTFELAVTELKPYTVELPFIDAKGNAKWVRTTGKVRKNTQAIPTHIYGAFEDITEQKRLVRSQKSTSNNFKSVIDNLNDSIVTISSKGIIKSANKSAEKTFGYTTEELIGKNVSILMPEPFASLHDKYMQNYLETGNAKIIGIGRELPAMKKDGTTFPMELSISEVLHAEEKVFIGIVRDITERKKAEKEIHKLAYYDEITGVLNRYSFEKALEEKFQKVSLINEKITVFLINIDKFSQVNLAYGEDIGDKVLHAVATRLITCLPTPNIGTIYRSGADSFYIILNTNKENNKHISSVDENKAFAALLLTKIRQSIIIKKQVINVQASIGILSTPAKELNYIDIKPLLELAVSNAKKNGGNGYVFSDKNEALIIKRYSELSLEMKSKHFISELKIVLQPQYSIDDSYNGRIVGTEALVRWVSPTLGFISPAEFIPLAEQNGAIIDLGDWVIEQTCMLIAQRQQYSIASSPVSINLSAKQIAQPDFNDKLLAKLDQYRIPYSMVVLEITESALIAEISLVVSKMKVLKEKGIQFSLDDFGTGYSSLSYIHHLPIAELKIDKSFVDNITTANQEVPIINSIIQMAQALSLKVVAEGVETKEQVDYLVGHGCNVIQGYYFSKPLPPEQWLKKWQ